MIDRDGPLWWLSFVDPTDGHFLGACIVEAEQIHDAVPAAWRLGCNPGGEVAIVRIPDERRERVPVEFIRKLLSRDDIDEHFGGATRMNS